MDNVVVVFVINIINVMVIVIVIINIIVIVACVNAAVYAFLGKAMNLVVRIKIKIENDLSVILFYRVISLIDSLFSSDYCCDDPRIQTWTKPLICIMQSLLMTQSLPCIVYFIGQLSEFLEFM